MVIVVVDRSSGTPVYRQTADILRERIVSGQYPAGSQLPTERELVDEFSSWSTNYPASP